jgi:DNA-binding SARP family transcriptional activator/tetratricopeptide (TPR) repeat protein
MDFVFGILGRTAMRLHGHVDVKWSSPRVQQVLAALLVSANHRVSVDDLVAWVWAEHEQPPRHALTTIHQYVTRLRQVFESHQVPARVEAGKRGCLLEVARESIDYVGFARTIAQARRFRDAGQGQQAHAQALDAVGLWRDTPLADLQTEPAEQWRTRWLRSEWIPANAFLVTEQLAAGQAAAAVGRLGELERAHPMQLSLTKLMIRALAAAERPSEATDYFLATHRRYREAGELRAADDLLAVHDEVIIHGEGVFPRSPVPVPRAAAEDLPVVRHLAPDLEEVDGRDELLAELDAFTTDSAGRPRRGVVVVTGGPGVGKTTFAVRWAHRAAGRYRNNVVLLDMRGDSQARRAEAGEVVDTLLSLLDYPVDQVVSPVARAAKLTRLLERRPMLIVLDNVRSTSQVDPLIGVLASCTVVVVSRWQLKSLSAKLTPPVVTVLPLDPRHAGGLLVRRIGQRARRDRDGVAALAGMCQGNPLALTLVADRAAARTGTRLATLANSLQDAEMLLDLGDEGDLPARSLRSAFTVSYRALPPAEQRVFAVLGLHPGAEVSTEALAAADGRTVAAVRRSLDVLVAAHLIEYPADLDRYRVHDLLHVFAASLAGRLSDVDFARQRMLEFYLQAAFEAHQVLYPHKERPPLPQLLAPMEKPLFGSAVSARQWLLRERTNLTSAVRVAAGHGRHDIAWMIPSVTGDVLDRHGFYDDIIVGLTVAADSAAAAGDVPAQASSLNDLGHVLLLVGNDNEAERFLQRALELVDAHGIVIGRISVLLNLARGRLHADRAEEATAMYEEALELARGLGEPERWAAAAHRLADALLEQKGREQDALRLYQEGLGRRVGMDDVAGQIQSHIALGELYVRLGRFADAEQQCRCASDLVNEGQHLPAAMKLNTVLARLRHAQGDDRMALRHAGRAVQLADRSRHATGQARAFAVLAEILHAHGNREDARSLWERAAELYRGRERVTKAQQIEALLVAPAAGGPLIPAAREGERDTVAMPPPRLRLGRDLGDAGSQARGV